MYYYVLLAYIFVSNLYIEIICVLFATIWAVKARAELDARFNPGAYPVISTEHNIVFGNVESYSRKNTSPLNTYEVNELYAAGAFKVAVIALQCVGFNDSMYRLLLEHASKRNLNAVAEKRNRLSHWQATVKSSFDGSPGLKNGSVNNNRNPRYSLGWDWALRISGTRTGVSDSIAAGKAIEGVKTQDQGIPSLTGLPEVSEMSE
ncbi:hypothetical protein F5890DRAFT_1588345 [Lentinula detonsa]|uniref:DUF6697 domain-containing protein n=1 Tax=Lentinula detonsa TaxID=2804962 RepID=A0AA38UQ04_9AGAR|nr:hypothetical protein F5890DRAFT_1588345 [Lentinula detonsa]